MKRIGLECLMLLILFGLVVRMNQENVVEKEKIVFQYDYEEKREIKETKKEIKENKASLLALVCSEKILVVFKVFLQCLSALVEIFII